MSNYKQRVVLLREPEIKKKNMTLLIVAVCLLAVIVFVGGDESRDCVMDKLFKR